jgi:hypothetical protein
MEFFIPGLLIFLVAIAIAVIIVPQMTPMIAAVLSILFLAYGVYDHYLLFAPEYRLSTWQDGIKIYAPFIMLAGIILFVIYFIFAFFTGGEVPVPKVEMPAMPEMPEMPTFNTIKNRMNNAVNNVRNNTNKRSENAKPANTNNIMSRSLFETI